MRVYSTADEKRCILMNILRHTRSAFYDKAFFILKKVASHLCAKKFIIFFRIGREGGTVTGLYDYLKIYFIGYYVT